MVHNLVHVPCGTVLSGTLNVKASRVASVLPSLATKMASTERKPVLPPEIILQILQGLLADAKRSDNAFPTNLLAIALVSRAWYDCAISLLRPYLNREFICAGSNTYLQNVGAIFADVNVPRLGILGRVPSVYFRARTNPSKVYASAVRNLTRACHKRCLLKLDIEFYDNMVGFFEDFDADCCSLFTRIEIRKCGPISLFRRDVNGSAKALSTIISNFTNLSEIVISRGENISRGEKIPSALLRGLASCPKIRAFTVKSFRCFETKDLIVALAAWPSLQHLTLISGEDNYLCYGETDTYNLTPIAQQLTLSCFDLRSFVVSSVSLDWKEAALGLAVARLVRARGATLERFVLRMAPCVDDGVLWALVWSAHGLEELDISGCSNISWQGVPHGEWKRMRRLTLACNNIEADWVAGTLRACEGPKMEILLPHWIRMDERVAEILKKLERDEI